MYKIKQINDGKINGSNLQHGGVYILFINFIYIYIQKILQKKIFHRNKWFKPAA